MCQIINYTSLVINGVTAAPQHFCPAPVLKFDATAALTNITYSKGKLSKEKKIKVDNCRFFSSDIIGFKL
jgi:hypothetical protein